jgi:CRP-like cAMP-binding protein
VARSDVQCYVVAKEAFQEILESKPELAATISEILSQRQVALDSSTEAARPKSPQENQQLLSRIAAFFGIKNRD